MNEEQEYYKVKNAKFLLSAPTLALTPKEESLEVVFVGRSNVGKSSLLNSLTIRNGLAKSSSTPGKTRLINFFEIDLLKAGQTFTMRFVDLPGFGYAKVSKSEKLDWEKNLTDFLLNRKSITLFIQLIDARHENLKNDQEVTAFLESVLQPNQQIIRVFTKTDKLKQNELAKKRRDNPNAFFISNLKKRGIDKLREEIAKALFE
jgi:GTP-binding protein